MAAFILHTDGGDFSAETINQAYGFLQQMLGLSLRRDCHIFVTDDWRETLPYLLRTKLLVTLWYPSRRSYNAGWQTAAGWAMSDWRRSAICMKKTIDRSKASAGKRIFLPKSYAGTLDGIFVHEATHILTQHLGLPLWVNEGIAMLAVELYRGEQTVRPDSLTLLQKNPSGLLTNSYRGFVRNSAEIVATKYAAGYWLTRFLHEQHPDLLAKFLHKKHRKRKLARLTRRACGVRSKKTIARKLIQTYSSLTFSSEIRP